MNKSNIVSWERLDEFGILSISNGKENYLKTPDFVSLEKLNEWTSQKDLKGIIVKGVGRNFSAGADIDNLKRLAMDENLLASKMNEGKAILNLIEDLDIPVIAAINGVCFGGGLEIALACHMRIASNNALFAFPEINHGLIPGLGGTYRLTKLLGNKSFEIILDGDMMNSQKANEIGLIDYIADTKDSFDFAVEKLKSFTSDRSIEVIRFTMQALHNAKNLGKEEALKKETELFCNLALNIKYHQLDKND